MFRAIFTIVATLLNLGAFGEAKPAEQGGLKIALLKSMIRDVSPQQFDVIANNFESVLKELSGLHGELIIVPSPQDLQKQLKAGEIKLGAFHGFEFAWMKKDHPDLLPLMLATPENDALQFVLVVAKESSAKSVGDLRGKKLAMTSQTSDNGRLFLDRLCGKAGGSPKDFFDNNPRPKTVEEAFDSVVDGAAQVALADRSGLKMFERRKPGRFAKLRILEESPPFPPSVIAYVKGKLGDSTLKAFQDGMNNTDKSEQGKHLMSQIKVRRFTKVPADFEQKLAEILKTYPPP